MKKIFAIIFLILLSSLSVFPETIVLKSGRKVEGKITKRTGEYIVVDFHGIPLRYYRGDIKAVYEDQKNDIHNGRPEKIIGSNTDRYGKNFVRARKKCFLWKVKSGNSTVYLLGSIHVGTRAMYPLAKEIEDAFNKSDILVVEANVSKKQKANALSLLSYALYKSGRGLRDNLSPRTYNLAKRKLQEMGVSIDLLDMYKPWYIAVLIDNLIFVKLGYDPQYGIDIHFLNKAKGNKEILELESVESQIKLLSSFSNKEQDLFLYYTLVSLDTAIKNINELIDAWERGDAETVNSILTKSASLSKEKLAPLLDKLIYKRNERMADKIEKFLDTGRNYFVVVGAGHLVGKKGIVSLLRGKGYSVVQL